MKNSVVVVIVLLGLNAIQAARPKSEIVLQEIEKVRPRYKEIQDFVIQTITDARFKSSEQLAKFHSDVLLVKQTFVLDAIKKEDALLFQVTNQPSTVDRNCLSFITTMADSFINLAGSGFSTCITETSDNLEKAISAFYTLLQKDETGYIGIGLLNIFKDENIFYSPESILYKLQQKADVMEGYPLYLQDDLLKTVNNLGSTLNSLEMTYIGCMTSSEQLLKDGFVMAQNHMNVTCRAVQVPTPPVVGNPQKDVVVAPNAGVPESEGIRRFRERFGL